MTQNQLKYLELMLTKDRDSINAEVARGNLRETQRHNEATESETNRHNVATERQASLELELGWFNAESGRMTAQANVRNAATNERNAATNEYNARINAYNAESNRMNAYSNRMNAFTNQGLLAVQQYNADINRFNAETSRIRAEQDYEIGSRNADVAERNARTNRDNYWLQEYLAKSQEQLNYARAGEARTQSRLNEAKASNVVHEYDLITQQINQAYAAAMNQMAQAGLTGQQADMYRYNNALDKAFDWIGSASGFMRGYGSLIGGKASASRAVSDDIFRRVNAGMGYSSK